MMLEKLSLGTFVKNLRNKMLPNNLIINSVAKKPYQNAVQKTAARNVRQKVP